MRLSCCILLALVFSFRAEAQVPDSVQIDGSWYYIYPIKKELKTTYGYSGNNKFGSDALKIYLEWVEKNDPRVSASFHSIKKALRKEVRQSEVEEERTMYRGRKIRTRIRKLFAFDRRRTRRLTLKTFRDSLSMQAGIHYPFDYDLIPVSKPLPDGRYIQYYTAFSPIDRKGRVQPPEHHVAVFFELKANALNNEAVFLGWFGDTIKHGKFEDGLKTGVWSYLDDSQFTAKVEGFKKDVTYTDKRYTITLHQGMLQGPYSKYAEGIRILYGNFDRNEPVGVWEEIEKNKSQYKGFQNADYLTRRDIPARNSWSAYDSIVTVRGANIFIADHDRYQSTVYMEFINRSDSLKVIADTLPVGSGLSMLIGSPFSWMSSHYVFEDDRAVQQFRFATFKEVFYPNGQLLYRAQLIPGQRFIEPTLYTDKGHVFDTIAFDAQARTYTRWVYSKDQQLIHTYYYDERGHLTSEDYPGKPADPHYVIDGKEVKELMGHYNLQSTQQTADGKALTIETNWTIEDTLLYFESYESADSTASGWTFYNSYGKPFATKSGRMLSDSVIAYTAHVQLGALSILSESVIEGTPDHLINNYLHTFPPANSHPDSSFARLSWKGQPYTGKFSVDYQKEYSITEKNGICVHYASRTNTKKNTRQVRKLKARGAAYRNPLLELNANVYSSVQSDPFRLSLKQLLLNSVESNIVDYRFQPFDGQLKEGLPTGQWQFYDKHNKLLFSVHYTEGKVSQAAESWETTEKADKEERNIPLYEDYTSEYMVPAKPVRYKQFVSGYSNGLRNGSQLELRWNGDTIACTQFTNGVLNGPFLLNDLYFRSEGSYSNNALEGPFVYTKFGYTENTATADRKDWFRESIPVFSLEFREGKLNGGNMIHYPDGNAIRSFAQFRNGEIASDYRYYDEDGILYMTGLFTDSSMTGMQFIRNGWTDYTMQVPAGDTLHIEDLFSEYTRRGERALESGSEFYRENSMLYPEDVNIDYVPALLNKELYFKKYFPDGNIAREGKLLSEKKTGLWSFSDYNGALLYTINYADSLIRVNDSVQIASRGIYTEYDAQLQVVSRRYVIEEEEKYDCTHSDYYAIRQYAIFEDAADSTERTNGHVRNFYDNGVIQSEGAVKNGLPSGLWKFYDPDGKLHRAGNYDLGKRNGRWLTGDLSEQKYLGEICLDPDTPEIEKEIALLQNDLDIKLSYYKMGVLQTANLYNWDKNAKQVTLTSGMPFKTSGTPSF